MEGSLNHSTCGPLDCFYILNPPSGAKVVILRAEKVEIHQSNDWLKIHKGRFRLVGYPDVVKTYSGTSNSNPEVTLSTSSKPIMIYFHVHEKLDLPNAGFTLSYRWHAQNCSCGNKTTLVAEDEPKSLTSPGYPVPYCNEMSCVYSIDAGAGYQILIKVHELRTEAGEDNLGIYDGPRTVRSKRIALLTGRLEVIRIHEFRSNSSIVKIWFTTDRTIVYKGFNLTYRRVPVLYQLETTLPPTPVTTGPDITYDGMSNGSLLFDSYS